MLLKAKLGGVQKFARVSEPTFAKFGVPAVTKGVKVFDSSGTELDDDVFEDIVTDPSTGVLTIKYEKALYKIQCIIIIIIIIMIILSDSPFRKRQKLDVEDKQLVESILTSKPGGEYIINEYNRTKSLVDETRGKTYCTSPPRQVKEMYARGIVTFFPYLSGPYSKNGYLAWRIKAIQRCTAKGRPLSSGGDGSSGEDQCGGPTVRRELQFVTEKLLSEDECKEAIFLMNNSADEDTVKKKMLTFVYRHNMVLDPLLSSNVLSVFPRFKDIKGLIEQDFVLMFGEDVSGRLLERWPTTFKRKIIQQGRKLPSTSDLKELLLAADSPEDATEVSTSQAERRLVVFKKTETNIQEHLDAITTSTQPYLLAVGVKKNDIHRFFIILDKNAIPCKSTSSLSAFDELFKAHFVFGTSYNTMLHNMHTFIPTTGFRKHLNTKHLNYFDQQADTDVNLQPDVAVKEVSTTGEVMLTNVEETPTTCEKLKRSNKSTLDMCASAVAQLRAAGLSQSTVNSFVSSMCVCFLRFILRLKMQPYRLYLHSTPQVKINIIVIK
ncbi:kinesin family member 26 [Sarotherodon galilaeus]